MDTVGKYENAIKEYIKNPLQDNIMNDQIRVKEFTNPFTGEQEKKGKEKTVPELGLPVTILRLSYLSMHPFEGDHRRKAFVGLGQTTRSMGGCDL